MDRYRATSKYNGLTDCWNITEQYNWNKQRDGPKNKHTFTRNIAEIKIGVILPFIQIEEQYNIKDRFTHSMVV